MTPDDELDKKIEQDRACVAAYIEIQRHVREAIVETYGVPEELMNPEPSSAAIARFLDLLTAADAGGRTDAGESRTGHTAADEATARWGRCTVHRGRER